MKYIFYILSICVLFFYLNFKLNPKKNITIDKLNEQIKLNTDLNTKKNYSDKYFENFYIKFNKKGTYYNINNDMLISNKLFNLYKNEYVYIINKYFTKNHLNGLKEITISNSVSFNNGIRGQNLSINEDSYILMASLNNDNSILIHELLHTVQHNHIKLFNKKYKYKWLKINKYVSEYAMTNIYEDFAETGTKYLLHDTLIYNTKFKLFKKFFYETSK